MKKTDFEDIYKNIVGQETQLAELHAAIYKRREEARNLRLSLPTNPHLDKQKLEKKKQKVSCSLLQLQQQVGKDIEHYTKKSLRNKFYLNVILLIIFFVLGIYLVYQTRA